MTFILVVSEAVSSSRVDGYDPEGVAIPLHIRISGNVCRCQPAKVIVPTVGNRILPRGAARHSSLFANYLANRPLLQQCNSTA